jgi:CheY-like chemotaxis protein/MinD-like ATPase involved in chromosome partitioning or flagellar assembly
MPEKILIVDDDLDTLKLVGLILQRQGYDIVAANSGSQGLAKASAERPNLVLLDVMMPDMEGYEVARRLRADPELSRTPIIMFTAKTLVDDKVAGFEAGVDDYMTKPTHPAELVSRVKALLARSAAAQRTPDGKPATGSLGERGKIITMFGAKGGLGVTTMALNLAVAMAQSGQDVILAEIRPGQGSLGLQLGFTSSKAVGTLLAKAAREINATLVEGSLVSHGSGVRLLLSSYDPNETTLTRNADQALQIVKYLSTLTKYLIVDLGPGIDDINRKVLPISDRPMLLVEPMRVTLTMAKTSLDELEKMGLSSNRFDFIMVNKVRSSLQMPWQQAEAMLGHSIASIITPAPELAYQAAEAATPMLQMQPDSLSADQARKLAEVILQKTRTPVKA